MRAPNNLMAPYPTWRQASILFILCRILFCVFVNNGYEYDCNGLSNGYIIQHHIHHLHLKQLLFLLELKLELCENDNFRIYIFCVYQCENILFDDEILFWYVYFYFEKKKFFCFLFCL